MPSLKAVLLNCCLKFKSAMINLRVTQIRVVFLRLYPIRHFCELYNAFNGIPIINRLPFFFQTDGNFYQIILSHTLGSGPNKSTIIKIQMSSEIKLLESTKVYYCFNSKGDNFNVIQL